MDCIRIYDLEVYGHHGVYEEENKLGQLFKISVNAYVDIEDAANDDDIDKSVNYGSIARLVNAHMSNKVYKLLEAACEGLAREILLTFDRIRRVEIEIKKPWAPIGLHLESVSVSIDREWHTVYVAFGSNMGNKQEYIDNALKELEGYEDIRIIKCSDIYETEPYGGVEQDKFLNGVVKIETLKTPETLLKCLNTIESSAGRVREIHWGPRTLDLDIIFYDDLIMYTENLIIPHVDMQNRDFVLKPLCDINPYYIHPVLKKSVTELLGELQ